jgi:hypothetical protein
MTYRFDPEVREYYAYLARREPVSFRTGSLAALVATLRLRARVVLPSLSPGWLTGVAGFLAGRKRSEVRLEWRSHLSGWPDHGLSRQEQLRDARGFLWSAVRFRLQDAADLAWQPVDAVLGSRTLSFLFVWLPVFVWMVAIVRHDGRYGLVADDQDYIALAIGLYATVKGGRRYRRIKLPKHKLRRARE